MTEESARTGGELFARLLRLRKVNYVFGTTGAGMPDIQDALVAIKPPKWIQGLHEFVTVSAAAGYALATEEAGVALIDRVVGTQNSAGAFYAAYMNSAPLVAFASANLPGLPIPTGEPEYHYYSDQAVFVRPWVKWHTQNHSLETLASDVEKAFHLALSEPCAPVYVTLRQDLMASPARAVVRPPSDQPYSRLGVLDDETARRVLELVVTHSKPAVVTSKFGRRRRAVPLLGRFATAFGLGVYERRVFLNLPVTHPLHAGFIGVWDTREVDREVDLVVSLDTGLLPHDGYRADAVDLYTDPLHTQDVYEGGDYGSSLFRASVRASCDTAGSLEKILRLFESLPRSDVALVRERGEKWSELHSKLLADSDKKALESLDKEKLDGWSVGRILNTHWGPNMSWVNGSITPRRGLLETLRVEEPGTYFSNPSGHLGVTVGMAYGVALAHTVYTDVEEAPSYSRGRISYTGHVTVCTLGDGEAVFGNLDSALWTVSHYRIPVIYIVLNNGAWGIEWPPFERTPLRLAASAGDFEFVDLDRPRIDFSKVADAFQVPSAAVTTPGEFEKQLERSLELARKGEPSLIQVMLEKYTGEQPSKVP